MNTSKALALAAAIAALPLAAQAGAINFSDAFTSGASSHWDSYAGGWHAHDGVYDAEFPSNAPLTISSLDFDFVGSSLVTIDVDVNALADGGIWLSNDGTNQNGILLVLGGNGYGPLGGTVGGHDIYWHRVQGGGVAGTFNQTSGVFTPGDDYHLTVTALNGTYKAYVDGVLQTSLTDTTFTHGRVGLYDEWPAMTFDNVQVSGTTAVPEPGVWALMIAGFGMIGGALRRRVLARA